MKKLIALTFILMSASSYAQMTIQERYVAPTGYEDRTIISCKGVKTRVDILKTFTDKLKMSYKLDSLLFPIKDYKTIEAKEYEQHEQDGIKLDLYIGKSKNGSKLSLYLNTVDSKQSVLIVKTNEGNSSQIQVSCK